MFQHSFLSYRDAGARYLRMLLQVRTQQKGSCKVSNKLGTPQSNLTKTCYIVIREHVCPIHLKLMCIKRAL